MHKEYSDLSIEELIDAKYSIDDVRYPEQLREVEDELQRRFQSNESLGYVEKQKQMRVFETFWPRLFAALIDLLPVTFFSTCLAYVNALSSIPTTLLACTQMVSAALYVLIMHSRYGQTLGQVMMEIKLCSADHLGVPTKTQYLIRDCIPLILAITMSVVLALFASGLFNTDYPYLLNGVLIVFNALYVVWQFVQVFSLWRDDRNRSFPDMWADTVMLSIQHK